MCGCLCKWLWLCVRAHVSLFLSCVYACVWVSKLYIYVCVSNVSNELLQACVQACVQVAWGLHGFCMRSILPVQHPFFLRHQTWSSQKMKGLTLALTFEKASQALTVLLRHQT